MGHTATDRGEVAIRGPWADTPSPEPMTDTPHNTRAFEETEDFSHEITTSVLSLFAGQGVAGLERPPDGRVYTSEFDLGGSVPRALGRRRAFMSEDVYIRLENTVYGPISQDRLVELLNSGQLTGYESASSDLQHWTPLLYHPAMNLSGEADPDLTHEILHENSSLPQAAPRRIRLEDLADDDTLIPTDPKPPSTPLAAIMLKPKKVRVKVKKTFDLPVLGDIEEDGIDTLRERAENSFPGEAVEAHTPSDLEADEDLLHAIDALVAAPDAGASADVDPSAVTDPGFNDVDPGGDLQDAFGELDVDDEPAAAATATATDEPAEAAEPSTDEAPVEDDAPVSATAPSEADSPGASALGMLLAVAIIAAAVLGLWFSMPR